MIIVAAVHDLDYGVRLATRIIQMPHVVNRTRRGLWKEKGGKKIN